VEVRDFVETREFEDEKEFLEEENKEQRAEALEEIQGSGEVDLHDYELRFNATRMA
jgi:translation initiation factor IF-3